MFINNRSAVRPKGFIVCWKFSPFMRRQMSQSKTKQINKKRSAYQNHSVNRFNLCYLNSCNSISVIVPHCCWCPYTRCLVVCSVLYWDIISRIYWNVHIHPTKATKEIYSYYRICDFMSFCVPHAQTCGVVIPLVISRDFL